MFLFAYTVVHKGLDFLRGKEYHYYGGDTLYWSDNKIRLWNLGLHLYYREGLRILGNDLDINGDGLVDVILTNNEWWYSYPYQHFFINLGGRRFAPIYFKYRADGDSMCHDAVWVGDLNGNGILDYVLSIMDPRNKTGIRIFYDFPFDTSRSVYLKSGSVETPNVADVNLDGYPDILVGVWRDSSQVNPQGRECSKIFFNSPSGFHQWDTTPCLYGAGTHPVFFADLDYDNFLDAFIGSLYYRGWFPPNFPPRIYWNIFGNFDSRIYSEVWFNESVDSFGTFGATVADLNNDGYLDIIGCAYGYGVVMWGRETGYSPFNKYEFLSLRDCRNVQAYDINGDGWVDVIFGEKAPLSDWRNGRITIYFNNSGNFSESNKLVIPSSTNYGILVMDFDGDGRPDILSSRKEIDSSSIYWNIGPPAFFDTSIKTNLYSVKASRNLSVQIFGNIYDRKNRFGYLSPVINLPERKTLRSIRIYGDLAGQRVKVYARKSDGTSWGRWVEVDSAVFDPDLSLGIAFQYRIDIFTNFAGSAKFKIDSITLNFDNLAYTKELPRCFYDISQSNGEVKVRGKGGRFYVFDVLGRRVYEGELNLVGERFGLKRGVYWLFIRGEGCNYSKRFVVK
jgi:hypothetical protein